MLEKCWREQYNRSVLRALLFLVVLVAALMASELRSEPGQHHEMTVVDAGDVDKPSNAAADGSIERPYRVRNQPEIWKGQPERLSHGFRLTKPHGDQVDVAACEAWTHPDGWELRLLIDRHGVPVEIVLPSEIEMLNLLETWRRELLEKGWS